jgi:hypothetical protein
MVVVGLRARRDEMKKLRVQHYPQIPCKAFMVPVDSIPEAVQIMEILAEYDLFQYDNKIKSDYSNASVLMKWDEESGEWFDWDEEIEGEWFDDPVKYIESLNKTAEHK